MADESRDGYDDSQLDYKKLRDTHETAGYREGLEAGEESTLQAGFDEGFVWGSSQSMEWAKLKGIASALVSFVQSSKDHSKNKDEVIGRLMEILEEIKALEDVTIDSLMLSPEHDLSSGARQSCRVDQDFCKDLEKISHSACSQGREEKSEDCAEEASGVCCKELDQKKPCTLDCQSGPTSRADKTNTRNTMTLQSAETVQNLLQKLNRIVGELGLDADAILPSIKQDLLHSN